MPVLVYIFMAAWLTFTIWLTLSSKAALKMLPEVYLGNDNLLKMLRGCLPAAQQKLQMRYIALLFASVVVLAVLIVLIMVLHTAHIK